MDPLSLQKSFLEARAHLLELAAFLDRCHRSASEEAAPADDYRVAALRRAVGLASDGRPERVGRILELLSDPTDPPVEQAATRAAAGAWTPVATESEPS